MSAAVSVGDLRKSYGSHEAVRGVSFDVAEDHWGDLAVLVAWAIGATVSGARCLRREPATDHPGSLRPARRRAGAVS